MNHTPDDILKALGLSADNPGAAYGGGAWGGRDGPALVSYDPSTGEPIARVRCATDAEHAEVDRKSVV